jgi:DNA-binding NarL/FixJ family response regulator
MSTTDWTSLTPRGQAILRTIAIPISKGYSEREIGLALGTSTRWVSSRMAELRDELEQQSKSGMPSPPAHGRPAAA